MTEFQHKNEFVFSADFSSAERNDGTVIQFTRSEARAISVMAENIGRVLSRNQILDAVSELASEKNDRNVDFLINRIRRKLGDNANDPKFIATRYGEGYVWLWKPKAPHEELGDAFVVIGPIRGRELLNGPQCLGIYFADCISQKLKTHLRDDQKIVVAPDYAADPSDSANLPTMAIELAFFQVGNHTECVISAKSTKNQKICFVERLGLTDPIDDISYLNKQATLIAPLILAKFWQSTTASAIDYVPLPVAMHEATNKAGRGDQSWSENDLRLRALRIEHPDNPATKLMYATHLHTKYVTLGRKIFHKHEENCQADEAEIEKLVLESLDFAQSTPEHAIVAAKLLYFVDRGYKNLALELASKAHQTSTSVASSLAILGQLRGFVGDTDAAVEHLRQAAGLSEKRSHFHLYTLVLLCQALMAAGRLDELAIVRGELSATSTLAAIFFEPLFSDPIAPSLKAKGVTLMLTRAKATAILKHLYYVSARLYEQAEHRENSMRTPTNLFVRRFGRSIVPEEIKESVPGLLR